MEFVNVTGDPRVSGMMELLNHLARSGDPFEVLDRLVAGIGSNVGQRAYAHLAAHGPGADAYAIRRLRADGRELPHPEPIPAAGVLARLLRTPLPKIVHHLDLRSDSMLPAELRHHCSAMAVPIFIEQAPMDWVILLDPRPDGFALSEMEELLVRTALVGQAIGNLSLTRRLFEANLKIQEEMAGIAAIQQALLPEGLPQIPGVRVAACYESLRQAGGDFYDFIPLSHRAGRPHEKDERWAFLIGDVSGHGPAAAMVMAMLHSILHAYPHRPAGPGEILTHLNQHLCAKRIGQVFATAFLAFFDPATRILTYARAGHNPPLLVHRDGQRPAMYLDAVGNLPLGMALDLAFDEQTLTLERGQSLVLYTDGVIEMKNPQGRFFDTAGLEVALAKGTGDAQSTLQRIMGALVQHAAGRRPGDDQTIVAIEVC